MHLLSNYHSINLEIQTMFYHHGFISLTIKSHQHIQITAIQLLLNQSITIRLFKTQKHCIIKKQQTYYGIDSFKFSHSPRENKKDIKQSVSINLCHVKFLLIKTGFQKTSSQVWENRYQSSARHNSTFICWFTKNS